MAYVLTFLLALCLSFATAQQIGALTPEVHPQLITQRCSSWGCSPQNTSIVIDANTRYVHTTSPTLNCKTSTGVLNTTICPDPSTCGSVCSLEGTNYANHGISTNGDTLTLNLFHNSNGVVSTVQPRVYLLDESGERYDMLQLLGKEFTFDVDVSKLPCGTNGALYLSEMDATGNQGTAQAAGAAYGTGYCDAQCTYYTWVNGLANIGYTKGACCNEMDIWEANAMSTATTPHPCNITSSFACSGAQCSMNGVCPKVGCGFNPYQMGNTTFYGQGKTIDTTQKFTVITQFISTPTAASTVGQMTAIRRVYIQNDWPISNSWTNVPNITPTDQITAPMCTSEATTFNMVDNFSRLGGLKAMGEALNRGMVLVMSIWEDPSGQMAWLDSVNPPTANVTTPGVVRGPCATDAGKATALIANNADSAVVFSNIRTGDIGSTVSGIDY